ncbi:ornithine cyclodeaminase family protein [Janthinobacterium sp. GW460P]|uniref:ornithine cyclodeaminase family protein n=1 Tax=unclassified Janthinobacterium TaxID=2610881 RepID=UPI000A3276E2|nr:MULTISPECIES: ornithine cyclodeaminase family protein [unclassified Janthinobacterium]MCC7705543.1 ornithine cyclodeaminase family protein [Janthinobacterium sp. GW460P]MCC7711009.1 ornithine cyclodeaminase family protein [Janthinobacterium sp. GW460W]
MHTSPDTPASAARLLLLNAAAVAVHLQADAVLAAVRDAFVLHSRQQGRVFPVIREALATGGVFGIKAGDVPAENLLGFKAAGFWPANRAAGGEPHQATIMLLDPATGRPVCIIDGNAITTARTGAAGALGLQQLARPGSASLCVFGTGVQATVQAEYALRVLPHLRQLRYVSSSGQPHAAFEARFAGRIATVHAPDADGAVAASDVVITATPGRAPLFSARAVRPGTHISAIGADTRGKRELPEGLLALARLVVDDVAQARSIGEAQWAPGTACQSLGDLLDGRATLVRHAGDITVLDLTGLALQDLTVARLIYRQALAAGSGTDISWPW